MKPFRTYIPAVLGALGITGFLLLFLLAGTSSSSVPEKALLHGAVKLSSYTEAPVQETETYATQDVMQVQPLEHLAQMEMSLESPQLEMNMPSMEMDFAPELSGTVPVGGVPSLAMAGGVAAPSGGALTLGEVDEQPRPLYAPAPLYPARAKRIGEEKTVNIRILLRKDGTVTKATPLDQDESNGAFHEAAISTVLQWRFVPCKKDGEAVQCVADQPFSFSINR